MNLVERIGQSLSGLEVTPKRIWVAFSGGMDSTVLLHLMAETKSRGLFDAELQAIHINHHLHPQSSTWAQHVKQVAGTLNIHCVVREVAITGTNNLEAKARDARRGVFEAVVEVGDLLVTAHHQQDQAETLLLQLLRGSGVAGLAAMPESTTFGQGQKLRPLLNVDQQQLVTYAKANQLSWIDDPSNQALRFDRNFLRHRVMPVLQARWPQAVKSISRTAKHCAQSLQLEQNYARTLLGNAAEPLDLVAAAKLEQAEQRLVLRSWLTAQGHQPLPSAAVLSQIGKQAFTAAKDSQLTIELGRTGTIKRHQGELYYLQRTALHRLEQAWLPLSWDMQQPLQLPHQLGYLGLHEQWGQGLSREKLAGKMLSVRQRQGGERLQPVGRIGSHPLKKLLQEANIQPWLRQALPLLYLDDELVAVADLMVSEKFAAAPDEPGLVVELSTVEMV